MTGRALGTGEAELGVGVGHDAWHIEWTGWGGSLAWITPVPVSAAVGHAPSHLSLSTDQRPPLPLHTTRHHTNHPSR